MRDIVIFPTDSEIENEGNLQVSYLKIDSQVAFKYDIIIAYVYISRLFSIRYNLSTVLILPLETRSVLSPSYRFSGELLLFSG